MDGKVVIGTELDTKSFDAQIKQVKRQRNITIGGGVLATLSMALLAIFK